jgi:tetratricopeptide (TPR) repeat protein
MDQVQVLLDEAKAAYLKGDYVTAQAKSEAALLASPPWPQLGHALHGAAVACAEAGQVDRAAPYWERLFAGITAGESYPALPAALARYNWAYTLRMQRRYQEAADQYRQALVMFRAEGKFVVQGLHNLAWAALQAGDVQTAAQCLTEAGERQAEFAGDDAHNHQLVRAFLSALQGDGQAAAICDSLLDDGGAPGHVRAHACWLMGNVALNAGDMTGAAAWAAQARDHARGDVCEARLLVDIGELQSRITVAG